ncbi:hypothetical protein EHM69_02010 [candidate division KSB1 bacterium]|nr:MAG: hypothetical protein EHM69_02010 [candidate division KSB1 bacterium]
MPADILKSLWDGLRSLIDIKPRHWFALALISLFILFAPQQVAQALHLDVFRTSYGPWIGVIAVTAIFLGIAQLTPSLRERFGVFRARRKVLKELWLLSRDERLPLIYCYRNKQREIWLPSDDPRIKKIARRHIIISLSQYTNGGQWEYTIPEVVWRELQRRYDKFVRQAYPDDATLNNEMDIFKPYTKPRFRFERKW